MKMHSYVAFLRGINVGGNKMIKMDDLREAFTAWGFTHVKTFLASGNVRFAALETDTQKLTRAIEAKIKSTFGFEVSVMLRTLPEIQAMVARDPFKRITMTPQTRLYVTFLSDKPKSKLKIPYESPEKDFRILQVSGGSILSVLTLSPQRGTIEAMAVLEKEFGKKITTRNWNTICKIAENQD